MIKTARELIRDIEEMLKEEGVVDCEIMTIDGEIMCVSWADCDDMILMIERF